MFAEQASSRNIEYRSIDTSFIAAIPATKASLMNIVGSK